jgi:hypothetical protein
MIAMTLGCIGECIGTTGLVQNTET